MHLLSHRIKKINKDNLKAFLWWGINSPALLNFIYLLLEILLTLIVVILFSWPNNWLRVAQSLSSLVVLHNSLIEKILGSNLPFSIVARERNINWQSDLCKKLKILAQYYMLKWENMYGQTFLDRAPLMHKLHYMHSKFAIW